MSGYKLPFDPAELAMLHGTGYFGVPDDKLEEIAEELSSQGITDPSWGAIREAAWACGIDPANLTSADLDEIREML